MQVKALDLHFLIADLKYFRTSVLKLEKPVIFAEKNRKKL
jgi:hypothetical protein